MKQLYSLPLLALLVTACANDQANHIGNPLLLPGRAVTNAVQNAAYDARRGRVEVYVKTNHPALIADITAGGGSTLDAAMDLAGVKPQTRDILALRLQSELPLYQNSMDALVVALMVHGN